MNTNLWLKQVAFILAITPLLLATNADAASPIENEIGVSIQRITHANNARFNSADYKESFQSKNLTLQSKDWHLEVTAWDTSPAGKITRFNNTYSRNDLKKKVRATISFPGQNKPLSLEATEAGVKVFPFGSTTPVTIDSNVALRVQALTSLGAINLKADTLYLESPDISSKGDMQLYAQNRLFCHARLSGTDEVSPLERMIFSQYGVLNVTSGDNSVYIYGCSFKATKPIYFAGYDIVFDAILTQSKSGRLGVIQPEVTTEGNVTIAAQHDFLSRGLVLENEGSLNLTSGGDTFFRVSKVESGHAYIETDGSFSAFGAALVNELLSNIPISYHALFGEEDY